MKTDLPTLTGYLLWVAFVVGLLVLGHKLGILADIDNRDPAAGSHIPSYIHE